MKYEGAEIEDFQIKDIRFYSRIAPISFDFIENKFISDKFYFNLTDDFNIVYRSGIFWLLPLILRKILENYLIDILRKKFGISNLQLFYNPNQNRFLDFSKLIANFKSKINEFQPYSSQINDEFITKLEYYREKGNSSAHSIDVLVKKSEIDDMREDINHIIKLLDNILNKIWH